MMQRLFGKKQLGKAQLGKAQRFHNREGSMRKAIVCTLGLAAMALAAFCSVAGAQDTMRVRGTIERVDGPIYVVKVRDGAELKSP
jgi:hypothetical protein